MSRKVDETLALFSPLKKKQAQNFCTYLENHRDRIINYDYYQTEQICAITMLQLFLNSVYSNTSKTALGWSLFLNQISRLGRWVNLTPALSKLSLSETAKIKLPVSPLRT